MRASEENLSFGRQAAVRAFWVQFFAASPQANFATEDTFAANDRAVIRWRYQWVDKVSVIKA
jgi:hypothetical protein